MTKKTTVSKSSSKKEAQKAKPLAKPKTAKASAKKTVSRTSAESSAKTSKAKKGKKTAPKNSKTASKSRVESAEGEKRVREIASKNITLKDEEKAESVGFSLKDVRKILKTKTDKKDKQPNIAKKKVAPTGTSRPKLKSFKPLRLTIFLDSVFLLDRRVHLGMNPRCQVSGSLFTMT